MSPDAKLRMDVYQEGQRAANTRAVCPYTDWRAGTWEKGRAAAQAYFDGETQLMEQPKQPIPAPDLTDEEIDKIFRDQYAEYGQLCDRLDMQIFARACITAAFSKIS